MAGFDEQVAIIGGGLVGCALAHELAVRGVPALLLEAEDNLALGASGANSGILHTGFDSKPGELETRLILRAGALRAGLIAALGVPLLRCGARLRAQEPGEDGALAELAANAARNGVTVESNVPGDLRVPGEAVTDPSAFARALADAATAGGATVRTGARVSALAADAAGGVAVELTGGERFRVRAVANCAGVRADEVAALAGERPFELYPRKGEFLVFEQPPDEPLREILLALPSAAGKGVLVFPTVDGHVIAGPTARDRADKEDRSVEPDAAELILERARRSFPPLQGAEPIAAYAGLRPAGRGGANYVLVRSATVPGLVHAGAIRSTGLSAAPALGEHLARMLAETGAIELGPPRALPPPPPAKRHEPWWRRAARRSLQETARR